MEAVRCQRYDSMIEGVMLVSEVALKLKMADKNSKWSINFGKMLHLHKEILLGEKKHVSLAGVIYVDVT